MIVLHIIRYFYITAQNAKNMREITSAIPQFLCVTISGKEYSTRRRGSAPAPVAQSELRKLSSLGPIKHNMSGGLRKPSSIASCQQSFARAPYGIQEGSISLLPRRSSLPVEVITGALWLACSFLFNLFTIIFLSWHNFYLASLYNHNLCFLLCKSMLS